MATTDAQHLEVHVLGAGEGESIIVQTPGGEWGVVDCFASSLTDPTTNAAYQFLEGHGVEEIQFLCMTHPHRDHFRGMSQLLDRFTIRSFWRPAVLSGKRLEWLLESVRRAATKSGTDKFLKDSEELFRIFSLVKEKKQTTGKPAIPKHAATGTQLLSSDSGPHNFEIWALAPSGRQIERYEQKLAACFDVENRFVRPAAHSSHNIASMALLIKFGETRIVLGGDVESLGWLNVLGEFDTNELSCHLVKVSHHGSTNGYSEGLWDCFSRERTPIAVITPYHRHRLPRKGALEHISQFSRVFTPCVDAIRPSEIPRENSGVSLKTWLALSHRLKVTLARTFETGRCHFAFDSRGNCVTEALYGPAAAISTPETTPLQRRES